MFKIKYNNLEKEFLIKESFIIHKLNLLLVKELNKKTFMIIERESGIILFNNLNKEKIKDLPKLKEMLMSYLDVKIFLDGYDSILKMIDQQKIKSGEYKIINNK